MVSKRTITCTHCHTKLPSDSEFCTACGEKIVAEQKSTVSSKKWKIACIICSVLLAICLVFIGVGTSYVFNLQNQLDSITVAKDSYYHLFTQWKDNYDFLNRRYNQLKEDSAKDTDSDSDSRESRAMLWWYNRLYSKYFAFCPIDSKLYHTANCEKFNPSNSFYTMTIEDAEAKGYVECPICH